MAFGFVCVCVWDGYVCVCEGWGVCVEGTHACSGPGWPPSCSVAEDGLGF